MERPLTPPTSKVVNSVESPHSSPNMRWLWAIRVAALDDMAAAESLDFLFAETQESSVHVGVVCAEAPSGVVDDRWRLAQSRHRRLQPDTAKVGIIHGRIRFAGLQMRVCKQSGRVVDRGGGNSPRKRW